MQMRLYTAIVSAVAIVRMIPATRISGTNERAGMGA